MILFFLSPSLARFVDVFRTSRSLVKECFYILLMISDAFKEELAKIIQVVIYVDNFGWSRARLTLLSIFGLQHCQYREGGTIFRPTI